MSFTMSPQLSRNSFRISNSPGFKSSTMDFSDKDIKRAYRKSFTQGTGAQTFNPALASVILSRRKSIDGADIMTKRLAITPTFLPSTPEQQLGGGFPVKLTRSRSLPCIDSWDIYGDDAVVVTFDSRRSSISSYTKLSDHLRSLGVYDSLTPKVAQRRAGSTERIKQDDIIYEVHKDKNYIVYATKEKLLRSLVDPRTDMEYISQYVATHMWHTNAGELLDKLVGIFNPGIQSKELFTTRMRVICIIQLWKGTFPTDLIPHKEKVDNFLNILAPQVGITVGDDAYEKPHHTPREAAPKPTAPKKVSEGMKHQFLDFHPTEIARQLTLIEHQRYKDIPRSEFVKQGWNKTNKEGLSRSPHIVSAIKKFNEISYWVAAEIVFCANSKQRVTTIKRFIQIANKCLSFNNFSSVMEIIAGLHMSSIQRLKKTWKALSSKYTAIFEEITQFIATEGNYRNYRNALSKVELPATPYLGVFLRDLTFIEDGNPDYVEDDAFLNFEKMRMLSGVLSSIAKYQQISYNFEPVPVIQEYIISGTSVNLNDAALHKYSLLCEASSNMSGNGTLGSSKTKRLSLKS